jgi:hypothetical protein
VRSDALIDGYKLGDWCSNQRTVFKRGGLSSRQIEALEAVGFVWDVLDENFLARLALVRRYLEESGHSNIPDNYVVDGHPLGKWCGVQRKAYKAGTLAADRVAALDALGFVWDGREELFAAGFASLKAFHGQEGHCRVPHGLIFDGFALGTWCVHRRQFYRKGLLSPERIEALERLGFIWDPRAEQFATGLATLSAFQEREGHCAVPDDHVMDGYKLGSWCTKQRMDYKRGKLARERVTALDELGFIFDRGVRVYEAGLASLKVFREREGHCNVPATFEVDGYRLGSWCRQRRIEYKQGRLSPSCITDLEALGFVWYPLEASFAQGLAALAAFRDREGHCELPWRYEVDGINMSAWCASRRSEYRSGTLPPDRIDALNALGFDWTPSDARFAAGLAALRAFRDREGLRNVPATYVVDDYRLGSWCTVQRTAHRAGKLSQGRVAALEELGFVWEPRRTRTARLDQRKP